MRAKRRVLSRSVPIEVRVTGLLLPLRLLEGIDLFLPERGRVHADAVQETGRAVRGQRVVEIENQGDDVGHEYA